MPQPPDYERQATFVGVPIREFPGTDFDQEFNEIKQTLDALNTNIALLQNDSGDIHNESVTLDKLSVGVKELIGIISALYVEISTDDTLPEKLKIAVVSALPAEPDESTLYFIK